MLRPERITAEYRTFVGGTGHERVYRRGHVGEKDFHKPPGAAAIKGIAGAEYQQPPQIDDGMWRGSSSSSSSDDDLLTQPLLN